MDKVQLECPKCMGELREIQIGDKKGEILNVDQCFACQGIWFDQGELRKMLQIKPFFSSEEGAKEFAGEWRDVVFDLKSSRCPHCKKEMERLHNVRGGQIAVDHCQSCDGTWLDGGEIRFLMKGRPIQKVVALIFHQVQDALAKRPLAPSVKKRS